MCGIIGYVGKSPAYEILIESLQKLEYRGYDSAGIAMILNTQLESIRSQGNIKQLTEKINFLNTFRGNSCIGIGHTRWATHGKPNETNAHPHKDNNDNIAVVHNGIIKNYEIIKNYLQYNNIRFLSDTDTEIIPNLIAYKKTKYKLTTLEAVNKALADLEGNFAIAIITLDFPRTLFVYRNNSPLIIGKGKNQNFCASDSIALVRYTQQFIEVENKELNCLTANDISIYRNGKLFPPKKSYFINWDPVEIEKKGFSSFMLKEIYEQPNVIRNCLHHYLNLPTFKETNLSSPINFSSIYNLYQGVKYVQILACGSSWHASLVAKHIFENVIHMPTTVYYASEFGVTPPALSPCTLTIAVSQSGETADVLSALKFERKRRIEQNWLYQPRLIAITNRPESSIKRYVSHIIDTKAGIEIGVAATKSFTAQLIVIFLLALDLAYYKAIYSSSELLQILKELIEVPKQIEEFFNKETNNIKRISKQFKNAKDFIYIAKGINFPIALEGALKLKEISYIHAEGYPSGEMKHGHIALLDENVPIVAILAHDKNYEKVLNNAQEAKARESPLIILTSVKTEYITNISTNILKIPITKELIFPIISIIPLQLLAYYIASHKALDVDKPRNLAKSVTVE